MDKPIEGNSGKPFRMVVEEGKVREFAWAVKSTNPAYVAEGQGQPWCNGGRASGTDESNGSSFKEQSFHF